MPQLTPAPAISPFLLYYVDTEHRTADLLPGKNIFENPAMILTNLFVWLAETFGQLVVLCEADGDAAVPPVHHSLLVR